MNRRNNFKRYITAMAATKLNKRRGVTNKFINVVTTFLVISTFAFVMVSTLIAAKS